MCKVTIEAVEFFRDNGGLAYHPERETPEVGALRYALAAADAEAWARREGYEVRWDADPDAMWDDDVERETTDYDQYMVSLFDRDGDYATGVGSVDLGPDSDPDTDPYIRVLGAELAREVMP